jgi:hypothetical protein
VLAGRVLAHTVVDNRRWDTTPVVIGLRPMMATLVGDAIRFGSEEVIPVIAV